MDQSVLETCVIAAVTALATKGAAAPANTLNLLWQATFGRWDPKLAKYVENNAKKYANDIGKELDKIPKNSINSDPDISIIGPAMEASKYYVGKKEIRKMFAKLIASEFNLQKADMVHHSFVKILEQMSVNDARFFDVFSRHGVGPIANIILIQRSSDNQNVLHPFQSNIIYYPGIIEDNFVKNAVSIYNLSRLGLFEITFDSHMTNEAIYDAYKNLTIYAEAKALIEKNPDKYVQIYLEMGRFFLTPYGVQFRKICID